MSNVPIERNTRQKRAIRTVLERANRPLTIEDILSEAKAAIDRIGIATVYRAVRALVDEGWLSAVDVPGSKPLYERAGKEHHHHFRCTSCERVYELDGCYSEIRGGLPRGFRSSGHDVTIYGTCAACRPAGAQ
jgi:Fur family ferric uptake transcriptional regulator